MNLKKFIINNKKLIISLAAVIAVGAAVTVAIYRNSKKTLDVPQNISIENNLLSWNKTENASAYKISVNNKETETDETIFDLDVFTEPNDYNIRIKAVGNDSYFDSGWSGELVVKKLEAPDLKIGKSELSWNNIENNNGYELYCDNLYLAHIKKDFTEFELLNINSGHKFQIQSKGDGINTLNSPVSSEISANKLEAPENLRIEGGVIYWNKVKNANKYLLQGDIPKAETEEDFFDLKSILPGKYRISVTAISDKSDIHDSDSNFIEITISKKPLGSLSGVSMQGDVLVWKKLANSSGYKIRITQNKTLIKEITENASEEFADFSEMNLQGGTYSVGIFAVGNDYYSNSEVTTVNYVKALSKEVNTNLGPIQGASIDQGVLTWKALTGASAYVINIMRDDENITNNNIDKNEDLRLDIPSLNLYPGNYTVTLYAVGSDKDIHSAKTTFFYTAKKLSVPGGVKYDGSRLSWNPVENADKYTVIFGSNSSVTVKTSFYDIEINPGIYNISVWAESDNREIQSSDKALLTHTEPKRSLGDIALRGIENGVFRWTTLINAKGYIISVYDNNNAHVHSIERAAANDPEVDIYALNLPLGEYTIRIKAFGGDIYNDTNVKITEYSEKMIRDASVRINFNYENKYSSLEEYWIQHYLNFSLKEGFTFNSPSRPQAEWNDLYTAFLTKSDNEKYNAAKDIGNDIIITYYYKDENDSPVVLMTTGGIPLAKNKLWGGWLWRYNGTEYTSLQGSIVPSTLIGGIVPQSTPLQVSSNIGIKNPAGGGTALISEQLSAIKGKTLFVDIDVIISNDRQTSFYKETVLSEIVDF